MATKIVSASDLRERMEELLKSAAKQQDPLYITYRSHPTAVLVGYEQFETLIEQLEDLSDVVAIYERRGEPRRPFEEYLAEREQRGEASLGVQPVSASAS